MRRTIFVWICLVLAIGSITDSFAARWGAYVYDTPQPNGQALRARRAPGSSLLHDLRLEEQTADAAYSRSFLGWRHALIPLEQDVPMSQRGQARTARNFTSTGFEAYDYDDNIALTGSAVVPPDANGAAGPDRLINAVNKGIEVWTKLGAPLLPTTTLKTFFMSAPPPNLSSTPYDPKVVYDSYASRFLVMALEKTGSASSILLAVSKTAAPASFTVADWNYLPIDSELMIEGVPCWADFPGFEVDEEAIYVAVNYLTYTLPYAYKGSRLWIIPKASFYAGFPTIPTVHDPYIGGVATHHVPAQVFGPGGVGGAGSGIGTFLLAYAGISDMAGDEFVQVVRVNDPLGTPSFLIDLVNVGDIETAGVPLPFAPQLGGPEMIATNSRQALDAVWRSGKLYLTANIEPKLSYDPINAGQTTAHVFKLDASAVTSAVSPAGLVLFDDQVSIGGEAITPGAYTYYPSIAVNSFGEVKVGYSASSPSIFVGAYAVSIESPGFAEGAPEVVHLGVDYYDRTIDPLAPANRWGDYSGIALDPASPRRFWVYNQYAAIREFPPAGEDGRWGTAWLESKDFLQVVPESLTFIASPGDTACDSVRVVNLGNTELAFTSLTDCTSGGFFVDGGLSPTLAPGDTAYVRICYTPVGGGATSCALALGSDAGTEFVALSATATTGVGEGPVAGPATFSARAGPTPFRAATTLTFTLTQSEPLRADVYDLRGRRVKVLLSGDRLAAGSHRVLWDGRDDAGTDVASGVYFVRVANDRASRSFAIVRLR